MSESTIFYNHGLLEAQAEIGRLKREMSKDALDAARYRWLRERELKMMNSAGNLQLTEDGYDGFLDAAMKEGK